VPPVSGRLDLRLPLGLALIGVAFVIAAARMISAVPPFENPDELPHLAYVLHLAQDGALPVVSRGSLVPFDQEGYQPPLYYAFAAVVARLIGAEGPLLRPPQDRAFRFAPVVAGTGPHRLFLPITPYSPPPLRNLARSCIRLRWVALAWALGAGAATAALAWRLSHRDGPLTLLAVALFLLNPRWVESAASVSNDTAATCLVTVALVLAVRLLTSASRPTPSGAALLGLACAAAALTKTSGFPLAAVAGAVLVARLWRDRPALGYAAATLVAFAATVLLPVVPWLVRNARLYGDPFVLDPELWRPFVAVRRSPLGLFDFLAHEFEGFRWSYWAVFGQFAVLAPSWAYGTLDVLLLVAAPAGLVFTARAARRRDLPHAAALAVLPLAWITLLFAAFVRYNRWIMASQGRLIYPAAACIAVVLAGGLLLLVPRRLRWGAALVGASLAGVAALATAWVLLPAA
jgi:hypothetical protein